MAAWDSNRSSLPAWLSAVVAGIWLLSSGGCVHINNYTEFSDVEPFQTPSVPLFASVRDYTDFESVCFLYFISKSTNAFPFAIEVSAVDESGTHRELVIDHLEIVYTNGSPGRRWEGPQSATFDTPPKLPRARYVFEDAIDRDMDFMLKVQGHYRLHDGTVVPVAGSTQFTRHKRGGLLPSLVVLSGV